MQQRPTRSHGTRWRALRFMRRQQLPLVAKSLAAIAVVSYLYWNVSITKQLSAVPSLRPENAQGVAQELRDSYEAIPGEGNGDSWLVPEIYRKENGCDFTTAVARFKPAELELNCQNMEQLEITGYIGKGFWREVFKAKWNGRDVAVKRVKEKLMSRPDIVIRHVEECATIFPIRNDPNIVKLVGWCETTVVVDYLPHPLDLLLFDSNESVPVRRALELARDAARGVAQLHNAPGGPFAHTDLQSRQFLINANGTLQLNDFNRVKYAGPRLVDGKPTDEMCMFDASVAKGKWRSPEEYQFLQLDEKLDIYSLSLVLWTLRARVKPFENLDRAETYRMVPAGVRPPLEAMSDFPQQMQDLIVRGWDNDPKKRPSAKEMADEIEQILASYEGN
uniref:Protein kinase domain-containing protein n=1 Tax=Peronospora matthiolae TaxID=2874970 RepID=A0AAV1UZH2_9STRA